MRLRAALMPEVNQVGFVVLYFLVRFGIVKTSKSSFSSPIRSSSMRSPPGDRRSRRWESGGDGADRDRPWRDGDGGDQLFRSARRGQAACEIAGGTSPWKPGPFPTFRLDSHVDSRLIPMS